MIKTIRKELEKVIYLGKNRYKYNNDIYEFSREETFNSLDNKFKIIYLKNEKVIDLKCVPKIVLGKRRILKIQLMEKNNNNKKVIELKTKAVNFRKKSDFLNKIINIKNE